MQNLQKLSIAAFGEQIGQDAFNEFTTRLNGLHCPLLALRYRNEYSKMLFAKLLNQ